MITLNEKQVNQLNSVIQELPTKFGYVFIELFKGFAEENAKAREAVDVTKAAPKLSVAEIEAE